jgi:hypothetical protein
MDTKQIAELIYQGICGQRFTDWHEGKFIDHISDDSGPQKDEILKDIDQIFRISDKVKESLRNHQDDQCMG